MKIGGSIESPIFVRHTAICHLKFSLSSIRVVFANYLIIKPIIN